MIKSKLQGHQLAKKVWTCKDCRSQHVKNANPRAGHFRVKEKPKYCLKCEQSLFFYFMSLGEANRFAELSLMQDYGKISKLRVQVPFPLKVNGVKITEYRADFMYTLEDGREIIEDFKGASAGHEDPVFKLKKKFVEAAYQVTITITH